MADRKSSKEGRTTELCISHLEKTELPWVAPCLNSMCQSIYQLLDISKPQIDPLPCQWVHHVGCITNESQPGPHIPAGVSLMSMLTWDSPLGYSCQALGALVFMQGWSQHQCTCTIAMKALPKTRCMQHDLAAGQAVPGWHAGATPARTQKRQGEGLLWLCSFCSKHCGRRDKGV